jgi:hypothetical protein
MFIILFVVSLFAATQNPLPVIEKEEERERLKLQRVHIASLKGIALIASNEKQDLERRLEQERALKSLVPTPQPTLLRSVGSGAAIPEIAKGYEEIYLRFINGKLIYRPLPGKDTGRIELPMAELTHPLMGTFDLSRCGGNTGQYLSIATGYKKGQIPANAKKTEIWLVPRFLVENEIRTSATHFKRIMSRWPPTAPIGIFWTWGSHAATADNCDYLTNQSIDEISNNNLYACWRRAHLARNVRVPRLVVRGSFRFCL